VATIRNIVIEQNTAFTMTIDVSTITNTPIDLSTYTYKAQLRRSYYSLTAVDFAIEATDPSGGELVLTLTATQVRALKPGRYVYDVILIDVNDVPARILEGIAVVNPGVAFYDASTTTTTTAAP